MNNNSMDNSELFFKVYRINYIKTIIFKYIKLYRIYSARRIFETLDQLLNYKKKEYLQDVYISFDESFDFALLPELKTIGFAVSKKELLEDIPSSVTSIVSPSNYNIQRFKSAINLEKLSFRFASPGYISPCLNELVSVTDLNCPSYRYPINRDWFPSNLKKLSIGIPRHYQREITDEAIPKQLEYLRLVIDGISSFKINSRVLPDGLKTFKCDRIPSPISNDFYWPSSITNLTIKFANTFPCNGYLPTTLKRLRLTFDSFPLSDIAFSDIIIPSSIEIFRLHVSNHYSTQFDITRNMIPSANGEGNLNRLKLINIQNIMDPNHDNQSIIPENLKYLEIDNFQDKESFNKQLEPNQLPSSIVSLKLSGTFNNGGLPLQLNQQDEKYANDVFIFPKDLEHVEFGDQFNQALVGSRVFNSKSNKLKSISFGRSFNQIISAESIPSSVESITINNEMYSHSLHLAGLLVRNPNLKFYGFNTTQIYQNIPEKLVSLSLPHYFDSPISTLGLENKSNLSTLEFGWSFNQQLITQHLPAVNRIKILKLNMHFNQELVLEDFKCLEILVVNSSNPKIIATSTDTMVVENSLNALHHISQIKKYNFYSLKQIQVSISNSAFLDSLDDIFYQFIKFLNK